MSFLSASSSLAELACASSNSFGRKKLKKKKKKKKKKMTESFFLSFFLSKSPEIHSALVFLSFLVFLRVLRVP